MRKNTLWIVIFLLPAIALFLLIFGGSTSLLFLTSFYSWHVGERMSFDGLNNYMKLFQDETFLKSMTNTSIWVILFTPVHVGIGVVLALMLSKKKFYWKFVRTVFMFPNIISAAALAMLYLALLNPRIGIVNMLLRKLGFEDFAHNWFFSYDTAFWTVTAIIVPFAAVITLLILAELASISDSILESAVIDGANEFQKNVYILLPMLRNVLGTSFIITATSFLKEFDLIYMTTGGGPGITTMSAPLYLYNTAMITNNYGYANAMGSLLIVMGIIIVLLISRMFRMGESDI